MATVMPLVTTRILTQDRALTLRFAQETDVDLILQFTRELAEYERLSHEVVADADMLRRSLFDGHRAAEIVIAEYDGVPAGVALFFHNFSTFLGRPGLFLEDLFVKPSFRGKGIGRTLFLFLAKLAKERGCGRLEFSVLDWNEPAIEFYRKLGAKALHDWTVFRITGSDLVDLSKQFLSLQT
jgi:GNAT superfamily N-acetyltransferase